MKVVRDLNESNRVIFKIAGGDFKTPAHSSPKKKGGGDLPELLRGVWLPYTKEIRLSSDEEPVLFAWECLVSLYRKGSSFIDGEISFEWGNKTITGDKNGSPPPFSGGGTGGGFQCGSSRIEKCHDSIR